MNELISIIVPVYKVEPFLEKCVDSIIAQTYRNLEIILVDDGSPDRCGIICDEYKERDERITVIHKENGGLSDARNAGLDVAKGEYIGFVDSDDWISPHMYEVMLAEINRTKSDLAVCCIEKVKLSGIEGQDIGHTRVYSRQKAIYELIKDKDLNNFAWNKLYRASLFQSLRFPVGRVFEDLLIMYHVLEKVSRVVHVNSALYHYLRRDDSILGSWPVKVELDFCLAQQERYENMFQTHPELIHLLSKQYLSCFFQVKKRFIDADENETIQASKRIKEEIRPFFLRYSKTIKRANDVSLKQYSSLMLYLFQPLLYKKIYRRLKKSA